MDEAKETPEQEKERKRKEYLEERAREQAALGKKLRALRGIPRHLLVRRVLAKWGTYRKAFSAEHDLKPKALSNMALRSLLAVGQACQPVR